MHKCIATHGFFGGESSRWLNSCHQFLCANIYTFHYYLLFTCHCICTALLLSGEDEDDKQVEYLIVGGGGSGGSRWHSGGGGGGGYRTASGFAVDIASFDVKVI